MPEKRITFKTAKNGTTYVYYTLRAYRDDKGRSTSDEAAIGKRDEMTGYLIPNRRYYEIFTQENSTVPAVMKAPKMVRSCGITVVLNEMAKRTGLIDILMRCFPDRWENILAVAFYILCEGNVMMYIEDWFEETMIPFVERMTDLDASRLFASITQEDRKHFFTEWIPYRNEREYIAYDVSSISTYSRHLDIAEWGYNRDHEKLPQLNIGMYYGMSSMCPVYYDLYSGSIPDKSYLEYMTVISKDLGIDKICFVMDRGFVSKDNLLFLHENGYGFITALPGERIEGCRLIDENKETIRRSANRIPEQEVYSFCQTLTLDGVPVQAHIFYDPEKQMLDEKELYTRIDRLQTELEKMNHTIRRTKKYTDYFIINEQQKDIATFELNNESVDEKLSRAGFFILISNQKNLLSSEILQIYRTRDVVEKNFDQLKNRLDFRRMRTHWNRTTQGKLFIGFLSLILRSDLLRRIKSDNLTKHLTFEKILIELRKIKTVTLSDQSQTLIPLTKMQKTILSVLDVPFDSLLPFS